MWIAGDIARVVYAVTESNLEVDVYRGENAGRELSHVAVVRTMDELGSVGGSGGTFKGRVRPHLDPGWDRENLSIVVFVQEDESRRIVGAGSEPVEERTQVREPPTGFAVPTPLGGAVLLGRFLESLLFEVGTRDPRTLLAVAGLVAAIGTLACLLPALRAARVDPAKVLRAE